VAVRWYLRYSLSYRDVEELLTERGITVDHVTVYQWVQRFTPEFTRALRAGTIPADVITDRAPAYPRVLDELIPSALHTFERYANNPVEADHGRLKARLRPMRGLKRRRSARILAAGHAFMQNLRRGHYELATDVAACHRLRVAFDQLVMAI